MQREQSARLVWGQSQAGLKDPIGVVKTTFSPTTFSPIGRPCWPYQRAGKSAVALLFFLVAVGLLLAGGYLWISLQQRSPFVGVSDATYRQVGPLLKSKFGREPTKSEIYQYLAQNEFQRSQFEQAKVYFDLLRDDPALKNPQLRLPFARTLLELHQPRAAEEELVALVAELVGQLTVADPANPKSESAVASVATEPPSSGSSGVSATTSSNKQRELDVVLLSEAAISLATLYEIQLRAEKISELMQQLRSVLEVRELILPFLLADQFTYCMLQYAPEKKEIVENWLLKNPADAELNLLLCQYELVLAASLPEESATPLYEKALQRFEQYRPNQPLATWLELQLIHLVRQEKWEQLQQFLAETEAQAETLPHFLQHSRWVAAGWLAYSQAQWQTAAGWFEKVVAANPLHREAYEGASLCREQLKELEKASAWRKMSTKVEAITTQVRQCFAATNKSESLELLLQMARSFPLPSQSDALLRWGQVHYPDAKPFQ